MTFQETSTQLDSLIGILRNAGTSLDIANAKAALSDFRALHLSVTNSELRPLRQVVHGVLEEYKDAVIGPELAKIQARTSSYQNLLGKLTSVNQGLAGTSALAPTLSSAANFIKLTTQAVNTIKDVKEVGFDNLTQVELDGIDDTLALLAKIPGRSL